MRQFGSMALMIAMMALVTLAIGACGAAIGVLTYRATQRERKNAREASKNDATVLMVFARHPGIALREGVLQQESCLSLEDLAATLSRLYAAGKIAPGGRGTWYSTAHVTPPRYR